MNPNRNNILIIKQDYNQKAIKETFAEILHDNFIFDLLDSTVKLLPPQNLLPLHENEMIYKSILSNWQYERAHRRWEIYRELKKA